MLSDVEEKLVEIVGQSKRFEVMLGESALVFFFFCLFLFFVFFFGHSVYLTGPPYYTFYYSPGFRTKVGKLC